MRKKLLVIAIIITAISVSTVAYAAVLTFFTLPASGTVTISENAEIGIYSDSGANDLLSSITFGSIEAGTSKNQIIYVKNEGDLPFTITKSETNWSPSTASSYLTHSWNYDGGTVSPNQVVQITLTLLVSGNTPNGFSFDFDIKINANS